MEFEYPVSAAQPSLEPSTAGWGPAADRRPLPRTAAREPVRSPAAAEVVLPRVGLCALLAGTARLDPARLAFSDAAPKRGWSDRPPMTWTYGTAAEIVGRLGRALRTWRLPPGSRIGLWFPGSTEGLVAHLAVEAAGHVPCPLPASWTEAQAAAGIQAAGLSAVLTQTHVGAGRPAEAMCRIAAGYFGLRYLAAFGPAVPDGVINLDALALDRAGGAVALPETGGGLVSFVAGDPARPVHRTGDALLAAVAAHLVSARIEPGDRILTLLPPSDLRGIVTGLGAALAVGADLETMPVFDGGALIESLAHPRPTHLVAPAFLEGALDALPATTLRSVVLARRAPGPVPPPGPDPARPVLDVLAFDEDAILSVRRKGPGLAGALTEPGHRALPPSLPPALFELRREPDGRLAFRGQACATALVQRGEAGASEADEFRASRFRVDRFAGTGIAVTEA
ncbi:AMP-binding protein [Methylobacterium sp. WL30]|nr:AMP-binding protein [Methylobacterium sp. WL30]TXN68557.1 AMP-binding protein [Methylobacterium sp. WL30]